MVNEQIEIDIFTYIAKSETLIVLSDIKDAFPNYTMYDIAVSVHHLCQLNALTYWQLQGRTVYQANINSGNELKEIETT